MTELHKNSKVWWSLTKTKRRPTWIPAARTDQAAEIIDIEGDTVLIGILNESRKMETYLVPISHLRPREIVA